MRDDAEGAAVVAAFRNFQIGVMARREFHALFRHEIEEGIMRRRRGAMHRLDDALIVLRLGDRENVREFGENVGRIGAHAAGHDDLAVLLQPRLDRLQRLGLGAVEKAAGVDDDDIGAGVGLRQLIALGAQLRDDALAVDERLGTAERDEGDARGGIFRRRHGAAVPRRGADGKRSGASIRRGNAGRSDGRAASKSRSRSCRRAPPARRPRSSRPKARRNRRAARWRAAHR